MNDVEKCFAACNFLMFAVHKIQKKLIMEYKEAEQRYLKMFTNSCSISDYKVVKSGLNISGFKTALGI